MKAIVLISGGLDSTLAARLVIEQGIDVVAANFSSPFCLCNKRSKHGSCKYEALEVAKNLNVRLEVFKFSEDFFKVIKNPKYGYGSNMNPCIDCRIFMLKKSKDFMQKEGASFLITGEVVGQRPMSQQRKTLALIEKESDLEGLILRPLSAKLLPETIPEKQGWVDRDKLLDLNGRSRKPQIALATYFGIKDYPCAAGGCLLTDAGFSRRLKDLLKYQDLGLNDVELLKVGRHFRLSKDAKLVVGRDKTENERLLNLTGVNDFYFEPKEKGPIGLGRGNFSQSLIDTAGQIISHYCDKNGSLQATIEIRRRFNQEVRLAVFDPINQEDLKSYMI